MNWDDVDAVIFDGTPDEVDAVRCPECGGALELRYFPNTGSVEIRCKGCGTMARQSGVTQAPNFALAR